MSSLGGTTTAPHLASVAVASRPGATRRARRGASPAAVEQRARRRAGRGRGSPGEDPAPGFAEADRGVGLRARVDEELGGEGRDVGEAPEVRAGVRRGPRRGDEDEAHVRGADVREHLEERARLALRRHRPERARPDHDRGAVPELRPHDVAEEHAALRQQRLVQRARHRRRRRREGISSDVSRPGQSLPWSYAPVSSSRVGRPAGAPHRKDIARRRRRRRASPRARTCASRHVT